tara:strand:+ start:2066 stop:2512 length:447 start_codon:yes stop_codon:yes gene_type:complete
MNSKLFLGIILIATLFLNMILAPTLIEGICDYEDDGDITGEQDNDDNPLGVSTKGAPVSGRTKNACNEGTIIENESRLKEATEKLNELKKIASGITGGVNTNTKNIKKNKLANAQMTSAVGGGDGDEEDKAAEAKQDAEICRKYPESC